MARFGLKLEVQLEAETPVGYQREDEVTSGVVDELRRAGEFASRKFAESAGATVRNLRAEAVVVAPLHHTEVWATVRNEVGVTARFNVAPYLAQMPDDEFEGLVMAELGACTETDELALRAAGDLPEVKMLLDEAGFECTLEREGFAQFVRNERPHLIRTLLAFFES